MKYQGKILYATPFTIDLNVETMEQANDLLESIMKDAEVGSRESLFEHLKEYNTSIGGGFFHSGSVQPVGEHMDVDESRLNDVPEPDDNEDDSPMGVVDPVNTREEWSEKTS